MRSIQLRCTRLVVGLALSPLPLLAGASETANVYVQANGGLLSAPNLESASDTRQVTDPVFGVGGVGSAAASLADGYLKLSVTSINQYIGSVPNEGSANAMAGLNTRIFLNGPSNVGGSVIVTMNVNGSWTMGSFNGTNEVLAQSGNWVGPTSPYGGFANTPGARAQINVSESTIVGRYDFSCINCSGGTSSGAFPFSLHTSLPFSAGQSFVDYATRINLFTVGGIIDATNTATFSIQVPEGFTYSSALTFQAPVPEPSTYGMLLAGIGILAFVLRHRLNTA